MVPETGLGPCSALIQALGMGMGRKYFIGETNVGRVHKTLLHFLSRLPQWGDFLEPSLGPPYWAGEGGRGEGGARVGSGAGLEGFSSSQEGKGAGRLWGGVRGIFMIINADAPWIYYKD